ncbi:MAG: SDR family oxidoreductase [Rhodoferax sp.]|nr:SDR family oxidoreductase [Rhodoferax sp.]
MPSADESVRRTAVDTHPPSHAGQRVLITAAASGIGRVAASAYAAAGARVYICDLDAEALARTLADETAWGGSVCDVADESSVAALFRAAERHLGGLDILVNNAGTAGPTSAVADMDFAGWKRCLAVNLDSVFLCARAAVPLLRRQGGGSIVNLSSTGGLFGYPHRAPYAAAKWAIRGLTRTLAQELGPLGIRVNCICPGSVEGERIERVIAAEAAQTGQTPQAVRERWTAGISLGCFVTPQDIAHTLLFLTSAGGARISGQDITVDGHTETL